MFSSSLSIKRLNNHRTRKLRDCRELRVDHLSPSGKRKILAESRLKSERSRARSTAQSRAQSSKLKCRKLYGNHLVKLLNRSHARGRLIWIPRRLEWPSRNSGPTRPVTRPQQRLPLVHYVAVIRAAVPKRRMKFRGKVHSGEYFIVTWNTAKYEEAAILQQFWHASLTRV